MKRRVQLGGLTSDVMRGHARFLALTVSVIKREHVHKYECIEFEKRETLVASFPYNLVSGRAEQLPNTISAGFTKLDALVNPVRGMLYLVTARCFRVHRIRLKKTKFAYRAALIFTICFLCLPPFGRSFIHEPLSYDVLSRHPPYSTLFAIFLSFPSSL